MLDAGDSLKAHTIIGRTMQFTTKDKVTVHDIILHVIIVCLTSHHHSNLNVEYLPVSYILHLLQMLMGIYMNHTQNLCR